MKKKCEVCNKDKGRRICRRYEDKFICSSCCANISDSECEGCQYLEEIQQYRASKIKQSSEEHGSVEINPELEKSISHALGLVEKGEINEGEAIMVDLQGEYPEYHTVYFGLGVISAVRERHDEAIKYFKRAVEIFPHFAVAHFNLGVAYQKKLDISHAAKAFKEVVRVGKPDSYMVNEAISFIKEMEQMVEVSSGIELETYLEGQDIFDQAFACMQRREWEEALTGFKAVLAKGILRHAATYGSMGICYGYLGQKQDAMVCFDKALEIDPAYEPAMFNLKALESLKDGETFFDLKPDSVKEDKEEVAGKKSLLQTLFQKLVGIGQTGS